ncbi:MAG: alpha/beta fold hydrolase [Alphaproteobacteria bacterium]
MTDPATWLIAGPKRAEWTVALAHGAGAPMDSPFMNIVADGLAAAGLRVVRFEFPYMARRRAEGKRGSPDAPMVLHRAWREVIAASAPAERLVVGGKSMGGRIASEVAAEAPQSVAGIACLGYPFHPPGRPERTRTAHLADLAVPMLVVQGERDSFGTPDDVAGYALSPSVRFVWLPDGDHSFKPRKRSGHTEDDNIRRAIAAVVNFVGGL